MESRNGRALFPLRHRPITLGDILRRAEGNDDLTPPPRPMARIMSPTRRLGPLANGRPRRPRTLNRPSATAGNTEDETRSRRRRASQSTSALARRRSIAADVRIQRFYRMVSRPQQTRRSGNSRSTRTRQNVAGRPESPDLFTFGFHRNNTAGNRQTHSRARSNTNAGPRSGPVRIQRSMMARPALSSSSFSRMLDVHETQLAQRPTPYRSSFMTPRNTSRRRVGRSATGEARRNNRNERSGVELTAPVRRFIDFAAEFIPLHPHPPDAEPPEWSLDVTPADFGPFAIGRSAISRDRSLAMIAALSQIEEHEEARFLRALMTSLQ